MIRMIRQFGGELAEGHTGRIQDRSPDAAALLHRFEFEPAVRHRQRRQMHLKHMTGLARALKAREATSDRLSMEFRTET